MGSFSNVDSISFQFDASKPTITIGSMKEDPSGLILPVVSVTSLRPPLSAKPAITQHVPRIETLSSKGEGNYIAALLSAQRKTKASMEVLTASCQVDTIRYGDRIKPRRIIQLRGCGLEHDGLYYVKSVGTSIKLVIGGN